MSQAAEVFQLKRIISFFGSANTSNQIDDVFNQVRLKERGRELLVNAKTNNVMDVIFCLTIKKNLFTNSSALPKRDWIPVFFIGP